MITRSKIKVRIYVHKQRIIRSNLNKRNITDVGIENLLLISVNTYAYNFWRSIKNNYNIITTYVYTDMGQVAQLV